MEIAVSATDIPCRTHPLSFIIQYKKGFFKGFYQLFKYFV